MNNIRPIKKEDINALKSVIDSTELFPSKYLDDMISSYLNDNHGNEIWFTSLDDDETPLAIAYCAPEKMTEGTWNLYLIAVDNKHQNKGIGSSMIDYIEKHLAKNNQRILIVETSGLSNFENVRKFYSNRGYYKEATIKEFYQKNEDKIIFIKKL